MLHGLTLTTSLVSAAHWLIVIALSVRVVMRRLPVGVSLAWLAVIFSIPFLGAVVYLFIGENRLGRRYVKRAAAIQAVYNDWQQNLQKRASAQETGRDSRVASLQRHVQTLVGFPVMGGNHLRLLNSFDSVFASVITDIDRSHRTCHLAFYIWQAGGMADRVAEALIRAAGRGVVCRVLVDAIGSKQFIQGETARQLREAGVHLAVSLPVGPLQILTTRADLRNHRKIIVIDDEIAYTGSQNLVDPRFFKQDEGVGQWIDAMVRMEGPCVEVLGGIFVQGWEMDTGEGLDPFSQTGDQERAGAQGSSAVQVVPSGPGFRPDAIRQLLLSVIYSAQEELVITTPYFIPDDSIHTALIAAAQRGVQVALVIPLRVDSRLAHYASRSLYDDLLSTGVRIARFRGGLLHTKSITVDRHISVFGSVNLDMRSLWLDFEISLFIYDPQFGEQLRAMQEGYMENALTTDLTQWRERRAAQRFVENAAHLLGPLL
jgi:cardiolipin synthase A/B